MDDALSESSGWEEDHTSDRAKRLPLGIIVSIGLGFLLAGIFAAQIWEVEKHASAFRDSASERLDELDFRIESGIESFREFKDRLQRSPEKTRKKFESLAADLRRRYPEFRAIAWSQRVSADKRASIVSRTRALGFPKFDFIELRGDGTPVPAAERKSYTAILHLSTSDGDLGLLGLDLETVSSARAALRRAAVRRDIHGSGRVERLVGEIDEHDKVLLVGSVYRDRVPPKGAAETVATPLGFVIAFYSIPDLLLQASSAAKVESAEMSLHLFDRSDTSGEQKLYPSESAVEESDQLQSSLLVSRRITVAGRDWLAVLVPAKERFGLPIPILSWSTLAAGLTAAIVAFCFFFLVAARRNRSMRVVCYHSQRLQKENSELRAKELSLRFLQSDLESLVELRSDQVREIQEQLTAERGERAQTENALRVKSRAIDASDNGIIITDPHQSDNPIVFVNRAFTEITGYPAAEAIGKNWRFLLAGDTDQAGLAEIRVAIREERAGSALVRNYRKDGRLFWNHLRVAPVRDCDGRLINFVAVQDDVTDLRHSEEELLESEARFREVVENSSSAICLKELDGRFRLVNRRFQEWFGLSEQDAIGKTAFDVCPAEDASRYAELDRQVLAGESVAGEELEVRFADGSVHLVSITKYPVIGTGNRISGIGTISTDITEQRLTEAQLRQAQKMEAVGQLTGGVAHDFNNLLAVVLGNLELAEDELSIDGETRSMVRKAIEAAQRGAALTSRLLAFSRAQALSPEIVDVGDLVAGIRDLIQRALNEAIAVEVLCESGLWPCHVDPRQLESALLNLAINARDAMPDGGRLVIRASNLEIGGEPSSETQLGPGRYLCIVVEDNGQGMPSSSIEKAFDPFFTTKEVGKGSGLGLSMVYGFAQKSGGEARIESVVGEGTTVRLLLPMAKSIESDGSAKSG